MPLGSSTRSRLGWVEAVECGNLDVFPVAPGHWRADVLLRNENSKKWKNKLRRITIRSWWARLWGWRIFDHADGAVGVDEGLVGDAAKCPLA